MSTLMHFEDKVGSHLCTHHPTARLKSSIQDHMWC